MHTDTGHVHLQRHVGKSTHSRKQDEGTGLCKLFTHRELQLCSCTRTHPYAPRHPFLPIPARPSPPVSPPWANPIHQASEASQPAAREGKGVSVPLSPPPPRLARLCPHPVRGLGCVHFRCTWPPANHTREGPRAPRHSPPPPSPVDPTELSSLPRCQGRLGAGLCGGKPTLPPPTPGQTSEGRDETGRWGSPRG